MTKLVFFLLGAFFVVVAEWVYLNVINRSTGASLFEKRNENAVGSGVNEQQQSSNSNMHSTASADSQTSRADQSAPPEAVARNGRTVVQAVSKGRAFLDRMAAKEAGETSPARVSSNAAATAGTTETKSDKTSITTARKLAKKHDIAKTESKIGSDDLKQISGIGPKIAELLAANGIGDFAALANADPDALKAVLESAGPRYALADVRTWGAQAKALMVSK